MKRTILLSALLLAFCFPAFVQGNPLQDEVRLHAEYTSVRAVMASENQRTDFILQGEYIAIIPDYGRTGLHLIANGDGTFRFVVYPGGLPGDGWARGDKRIMGDAVRLSGDKLEFAVTRIVEGDTEREVPEVLKSVVVPYTITLLDRVLGGITFVRGDGPIVKLEIPAVGDSWRAQTFEKVVRVSPTMGARPPAGALVLFDGRNLDHFLPGAEMNTIVVRGDLANLSTLWAGATTKPFEQGRAYRLHLEFMIPYMPTARGLVRGNSGVFLGERYECQILDSFGLEGEYNECGGFYHVARPIVNMCFPPLTWQTYEIEFTPTQFENGEKSGNARATVWHNGVLIHDDIEFNRELPGRQPETDEARGIYLQGGWSQVQFRNIWVQYK